MDRHEKRKAWATAVRKSRREASSSRTPLTAVVALAVTPKVALESEENAQQRTRKTSKRHTGGISSPSRAALAERESQENANDDRQQRKRKTSKRHTGGISSPPRAVLAERESEENARDDRQQRTRKTSKRRTGISSPPRAALAERESEETARDNQRKRKTSKRHTGISSPPNDITTDTENEENKRGDRTRRRKRSKIRKMMRGITFESRVQLRAVFSIKVLISAILGL